MSIYMVPELTHLQFLVLTTLMSSEKAGSEIRDELKKEGAKKSLASFYQLMARLEEAGMVHGRYEPIEVDGYLVKERRYKVKGQGKRAWNQTRNFYTRLPLALGVPDVV